MSARRKFRGVNFPGKTRARHSRCTTRNPMVSRFFPSTKEKLVTVCKDDDRSMKQSTARRLNTRRSRTRAVVHRDSSDAVAVATPDSASIAPVDHVRSIRPSPNRRCYSKFALEGQLALSRARPFTTPVRGTRRLLLLSGITERCVRTAQHKARQLSTCVSVVSTRVGSSRGPAVESRP